MGYKKPRQEETRLKISTKFPILQGIDTNQQGFTSHKSSIKDSNSPSILKVVGVGQERDNN